MLHNSNHSALLLLTNKHTTLKAAGINADGAFTSRLIFHQHISCFRCLLRPKFAADSLLDPFPLVFPLFLHLIRTFTSRAAHARFLEV